MEVNSTSFMELDGAGWSRMELESLMAACGVPARTRESLVNKAAVQLSAVMAITLRVCDVFA